MFTKIPGSAQYVVIVQYPIEEEKGSVGSSSLHVKHYQIPVVLNYGVMSLFFLQC